MMVGTREGAGLAAQDMEVTRTMWGQGPLNSGATDIPLPRSLSDNATLGPRAVFFPSPPWKAPHCTQELHTGGSLDQAGRQSHSV